MLLFVYTTLILFEFRLSHQPITSFGTPIMQRQGFCCFRLFSPCSLEIGIAYKKMNSNRFTICNNFFYCFAGAKNETNEYLRILTRMENKRCVNANTILNENVTLLRDVKCTFDSRVFKLKAMIIVKNYTLSFRKQKNREKEMG